MAPFRRRHDHVLLVSAGGDYDPSLRLIDENWSKSAHRIAASSGSCSGCSPI
jgi:hypothetical protein